jgi:hypothetical protein
MPDKRKDGRSRHQVIEIAHMISLDQSWLLLPNTACLAEKQQIPILVFGLIGSGLNLWSTVLEESTLITIT